MGDQYRKDNSNNFKTRANSAKPSAFLDSAHPKYPKNNLTCCAL